MTGEQPSGRDRPPAPGRPRSSAPLRRRWGRRRRVILLATGGVLAIALGTGGGLGLDGAANHPAPRPTAGSPGVSGGTTQGRAVSVFRAHSATAAQEVGVVDVNTTLGYQGTEAAGTGMVLTAGGEVLTNNHVIDGATLITVTVPATHARYTARVVGTDPTQDVAVLQLDGARGLRTVTTESAVVTVREKVTGVGNAGGLGGVPSAADGRVTATGQTITATDEGGADPQTLHGLIQDSTDIRPGDSGGPLLDQAGRVVGMDTAAGTTRTGATAAGYAIPIGRALAAARQIEAGRASATIHVRPPAFLGVMVSPRQTVTGGARVQGVLRGTPAAAAGMVRGDLITSIGGRRVRTVAGLHVALSHDHPGQRVLITWTDTGGRSHTAAVVLATGTPD